MKLKASNKPILSNINRAFLLDEPMIQKSPSFFAFCIVETTPGNISSTDKPSIDFM